jgi:hypothetical protein
MDASGVDGYQTVQLRRISLEKLGVTRDLTILAT